MADCALLVIGSGPAGVSAAAAFRDAGGTGAVRIASTDVDVPYDRPPLSKDLLQGGIEPDAIALHDEGFYADRDIDLALGSEATSLDTGSRTATFADGATVGFDACVLATGSRPVRPPIPGADLPFVHTLRSLREGLALRGQAVAGTRAVVVGSGFIGCEAAASLAIRGLDVTLLTDESAPHAARLGPAVGERLAAWLDGYGVTVRADDELARIADGDTRRVHTAGGRVVDTDLVLLATGAAPVGKLAETSGLRMQDGRVRVDSSMRTDVDGIFAAGDIALATNDSAGRAIHVEHWGEALTMGEIAGTVAAGGAASWAQAPGFWSEIGAYTLKYSAWGDGFDDLRFVAGDDSAFTAWYLRDARVVGVLTHEADDDYERGQRLVEDGAHIDALGQSGS